MKTKIKEIAKQYNYFTFENMPENVLNDEWFKSKQEFKKGQFSNIDIPDGLKNIEGIEVCVFAEVREQFFNNFKNDGVKKHELFYIESFPICVYVEKHDCLMILHLYKGKYHFAPVYRVINKLTFGLSSSQYRPFIDKITRPNDIGVFTAKKVNDWAIYCNEYINALEECNKVYADKKAENESKINETIAALHGAKVDRYNGWVIVTTKLFRIEFQLLENGSYLSQKIEYKGTLQDIINHKL